MPKRRIRPAAALLVILGGTVAIAVVLERLDAGEVSDHQWWRFLKEHDELIH